MSLNSIKRDLKDYIEENKARLEAWENVTYLTKKIKSLEKRLEIIDYAYEEFSKSYDDIRENLKELCENDDFLASMICKDIVKRQNYW